MCYNHDILTLEVLKMLNFKLKDINNPFEMRQGETIVDLDRYVEVLKENNIPFTKEQYEEAKKEFNMIKAPGLLLVLLC